MNLGRMRVGDCIHIDGLDGRVVANISQMDFSAEYPAETWAWLGTGILVETEEIGLVHYPGNDSKPKPVSVGRSSPD